ncbi:IPT/TIG domain-containing protein [Hymenobacter sp. DH14]|uniref:IPT/TIG domain-containing protein n=1 Tax=Hymenobacter cyanobacteriorum TaxID=2926463 RepID=A0A9X1VIE3_9BACT|nr:IPT/TIG domain-containing protein [Hymenobacter cyanobacteriorum]MCI1189391.1 IPT/TIG domain-containing protein [Hymenobacter cyanobacteriorum]
MKCFYRLGLLLGLMVQVLLRPAAAVAAPFTPGNIVIARVGDGAAPLSSASTAVFLDEYTPAGMLVQTVAMPTAVSGNNRAFTVNGTSTAELALARTADGQALVLTGYGAVPGISGISTSATTDYARVIGLVGANGAVNTATSLGGAFSGGSPRSVASVDGTAFYATGTGTPAGVHYVALNGFAPTQLTTATFTSRVLNIAGGNLYLSTATSTYNRISQIGSGLPSTAGQSVTGLTGFNSTASVNGITPNNSPYGYYFADLSTTVVGVDVAYVADDAGATGGIQKWSLVGGSWTFNGIIASSATVQVRGLDGTTNGTTVGLVATSPTGLFVLSDASGYNAAPTLSAMPNAVASNTANTAFRGVAFAPVAAVAAPTITNFTPTSGTAGTTVTVTGTDFTGATALTLNGVAITGFTVVNSTTITFTVPAGATSGPIAVTTPASTATSTASFTVTLPAPTITSLSPATAVAGGAAFTLTVNGTGFLSGSVVSFNGTALTTTFVSATQLTAAVPASAIATAGTYNVTVANPSANQGGTSAAATFTVTAPPAPTITGFTPARALAGTGFTLTINGTNLTAGTTVNFNGASYTGTVVGSSGTAYTVTIPAAGVPAAGTYPITVTNAGGTSAALSFLVVAPATTVAFEDFEQGTKTAYAAATVTLRSGDWTFTDALIGNQFNDKVNQIQGARIRGGSIAMNFDKPTGAGVITLNAAMYGNDAATSFVLEISTNGGTSYSVVPGAPTALSTTLTPYSFTVNQAGNVRLRISNTNTTAGTGSRINVDDITITNYTAPAVPTITSFTPTSGGPGATVTVTGTNLTGATAVQIGTFTVTNFTVVNATTITFVVPSGTGSVSGLISVTTPGGTATGATPFNLVSATLAANALPGLAVYPNPATDRMMVELPTTAPATVALRDLTGRLVLAPVTLRADHVLRLPASLASGVYLLEVRQGNDVAIRRIEKN